MAVHRNSTYYSINYFKLFKMRLHWTEDKAETRNLLQIQHLSERVKRRQSVDLLFYPEHQNQIMLQTIFPKAPRMSHAWSFIPSQISTVFLQPLLKQHYITFRAIQEKVNSLNIKFKITNSFQRLPGKALKLFDC